MHQTLDLIRRTPGLDLVLIITGMHLSTMHGNTISEIKKDGFKIGAIVDAHIKDMDNCEMAISMGYCLIGIAESLGRIKPDLVLIEGDRGEALAAAIAAAHMNIPVIHVSGGDISGSIDNSIRKAITSFAHMHLVNTHKSAEHLKKSEQAWRVKMVGSLGLDHRFERLIQPEKLAVSLGLDMEKELILVVQHPVTNESKDAGLQMRSTLNAIVKLQRQTIVIYPNSDAGSRDMIEMIKKYRKYNFIKIYKTLPRREFLSLMSMSDVMIGNSSAGIVEAPMFNLPVINIGTRQEGRERAENVIDREYDSEKIYDLARKILAEREKWRLKKMRTPYKDVNSANKILEVLLKVKIDNKLLNKQGI